MCLAQFIGQWHPIPGFGIPPMILQDHPVFGTFKMLCLDVHILMEIWEFAAVQWLMLTPTTVLEKSSWHLRELYLQEAEQSVKRSLANLSRESHEAGSPPGLTCNRLLV